MHLFRDAVDKDPLFTRLHGIVEIDETYFGGKEHRHRKYGKTGFRNKIVVIGIRSRGGKIKSIALPQFQRTHTIKQILKAHVKKDSVLYTDDHLLHRKFSQWGYKHKVVNKLFGFLVKPDIHIKNILLRGRFHVESHLVCYDCPGHCFRCWK